MELRKILVALDFSNWAYKVINYVGSTFGDGEGNLKITLFHVMSPFYESFWNDKPLAKYRLEDLQAWDVAQRKAVESQFQKLIEELKKFGFSEDSIEISIQPFRVGVAQDIIFEAKKGYDALIVGRRGASRLKDIIIGTTSSKILNAGLIVPLWVIGENPEGKDFLLGVDDSEASMKVVQYVAKMAKNTDRLIFLVHIVRALELLTATYDPFFTLDSKVEWMKRLEQEHMKEVRDRMGDFFDKAQALLREAGIRKNNIRCEIVTGSFSRAYSILEEARNRGCSTIFVGRRGMSKVEEFLMGRVSNKVLQMSTDKTVCVVG